MWVAVSAQPVPGPSSAQATARVSGPTSSTPDPWRTIRSAQGNVGTPPPQRTARHVDASRGAAAKYGAGAAAVPDSQLRGFDGPEHVRSARFAAAGPAAGHESVNALALRAAGHVDVHTEAAIGQRQRPKARRVPPAAIVVVDDRGMARSGAGPAAALSDSASAPIYERAAAVLGGGTHEPPAARKSADTETLIHSPAGGHSQEGATDMQHEPGLRAADDPAADEGPARRALPGQNLVLGACFPGGSSLPSLSEGEPRPEPLRSGEQHCGTRPEPAASTQTPSYIGGMPSSPAVQAAIPLDLAGISLKDSQAGPAPAREAEAAHADGSEIAAVKAPTAVTGLHSEPHSPRAGAATAAQRAAASLTSSCAANRRERPEVMRTNGAALAVGDDTASTRHHQRKRRRSTRVGLDPGTGELRVRLSCDASQAC